MTNKTVINKNTIAAITIKTFIVITNMIICIVALRGDPEVGSLQRTLLVSLDTTCCRW